MKKEFLIGTLIELLGLTLGVFGVVGYRDLDVPYNMFMWLLIMFGFCLYFGKFSWRKRR